MIFAFILVPADRVSGRSGDGGKVPVIVMCRPTVDQINNIRVMRKAGLLGEGKIELVCVYHRDELTDYNLSREYVRIGKLDWISFVEIKGRAGKNELFGTNIWTAQFREIFESSDGIIFTGGMDIPPSLYNEENSLLTEAVTPYRTLYETSFLFHLIGGYQDERFRAFLEDRPGYPVLGICLGAQTMNVASGGTLVQDIPSEIYGLSSVESVIRQDRERIHSSRYFSALFPGNMKDIAPAFHTIRITGDSILVSEWFKGLKGYPLVLSSHHQSVKKPGKDLIVAARSSDGKIVEALEHRKYKNVIGFQFHPEYRFLYDGIVFFTYDPDNGDYFSLKTLMKKNPPSVDFHVRLWKWFSERIRD